jgi:hypothetical protein
MNPPVFLEKGKQPKHSKSKDKQSFPWFGLVLVAVGLGLIFYFIDSPDVNKIAKPKDSSSFLGGADGKFKN